MGRSRAQRFEEEPAVTPRQQRVEAAVARTPRKETPPPIRTRRNRKTEELKAIRASAGE